MKREAQIRETNAAAIDYLTTPPPVEAEATRPCDTCGTPRIRYVYAAYAREWKAWGYPERTRCDLCGPLKGRRPLIDYGTPIEASYACVEHDVWLVTFFKIGTQAERSRSTVERRHRLGNQP